MDERASPDASKTAPPLLPISRIHPEHSDEAAAAAFSTLYRSRMTVVFPALLAQRRACRAWTERSHLQTSLGGTGSTVRVQTSPNNHIFNAVYHRSADTATMSVGAMLDATLFAHETQWTGGGGCHSPRNGGGDASTSACAGAPARVYYKGKLSAALCEDFGPPPVSVFGTPTAGPAVVGETTFWVGSGGVVTPLHFDHCHTVIAQVVGHKRVIVSPLEDSQYLYPRSVADGAPRTSRVNLHAWLANDEEQRSLYPDVAFARLYECVIGPGDVIYIPPGWWHHVEALEGNCSVLLPFDMNEAEQRALPRPWSSPTWGIHRSGSTSRPPAATEEGVGSVAGTARTDVIGGATRSNTMESSGQPMQREPPTTVTSELAPSREEAEGSPELPESEEGSETDWTGLADFADDPELFDSTGAPAQKLPVPESDGTASFVLPEYPVASCSTLTTSEFATTYRNRMPVLFRAFAHRWRACTRWRDAEYLATLSEAMSTVLISSNGSKYLKCDCEQIELPFGAMVRDVFGRERRHDRRSARAPLTARLAQDCELEAISSLVGSGAFKTHNCTVWLGHGGNVTPLHYDLCHIRGIKRFTYIHPDDSRHVYQRPDRPEVSRVDYCLWKAGASSPEGVAEQKKFSGFAKATCVWSIEVHPGDVIYTPPYFWHHVETLGDEPALSVLLPFDPNSDEQPHACHFWTTGSCEER